MTAVNNSVERTYSKRILLKDEIFMMKEYSQGIMIINRKKKY
jgi:hypothetical protein